MCICVNKCAREREWGGRKNERKESKMTWEGCDWWGVSKHVDLFRYQRNISFIRMSDFLHLFLYIIYLLKPSISFSLHELKVLLLILIFSSLLVYLFCLSDLFVFSNFICHPSICQCEAQCIDLSKVLCYGVLTRTFSSTYLIYFISQGWGNPWFWLSLKVYTLLNVGSPFLLSREHPQHGQNLEVLCEGLQIVSLWVKHDCLI